MTSSTRLKSRRTRLSKKNFIQKNTIPTEEDLVRIFGEVITESSKEKWAIVEQLGSIPKMRKLELSSFNICKYTL